MPNKTPKLIVLEGIDGTGKSTAIANIKNKLGQENFKYTRMPGGCAFSERQRSVFINDDITTLAQTAIACGMNAETHLTTIDQWMREGNTVISDRSFGSTYAYQGYQSDSANVIVSVLRCLPEHLLPSLTLYFTVDPEIAKARETAPGRDADRYLQMPEHDRKIIRMAYESLYMDNPISRKRDQVIPFFALQRQLAKCVKIIDANQSEENVAEQCLAAITEHLSN